MATGSGTGTAATAGAITYAQVYGVVLQRLRNFNVDITDITEELRSTLYDISSRWDFLKARGTITTTDGDYDYAASGISTSFKRPIEVRQSEEAVLDPISFEDFQRNLQDTSTPEEGKPDEYAFWDDTFYLWPVPDAAYTVYVYYSYYHPNSVASIEFGEVFRECIYAGVLRLLWKGQLAYLRELAQAEYVKWDANYEREIQKRKTGTDREPVIIKYHDL